MMADEFKPTGAQSGVNPTTAPRSNVGAPNVGAPNAGVTPQSGAPRPSAAAGGFRPNPTGAQPQGAGQTQPPFGQSPTPPPFGQNPSATPFGQNQQQPQGQQSQGFAGSARNLGNNTSNVDLVMSIPVEVQIVLGSTTMPVSTLMNLGRGAVITLDKQIGDPVDIVVNGRIIARGEVIVLEDDSSRFGVSLIEVIGR